MGSLRTTTRTIRIENETAEYFKEKALNRAVESLYGLLRSGEMSFDGERLKIEGCTHGGSLTTEKADYESIEEMAALMSVTTEKLLMDIRELLEEGSLYYSEGKLVNPRYEEFERACKGKDIDRILDSVVRSL